MIRVDRERQDPRSKERTPIQPPESWFKSAKQATAKAIAEGKAHRVGELYRHQDVRKALEGLFYDKCAYCESLPGPSSSWDVEHYRPKGGVVERPDHPGYYWLAYTWTNLYMACALCNQRRKDAPRWDDPQTLPAAGKATQFPLEDEGDRAMSPKEDLGRERPLLLDPCDPAEDPEAHLTYDSRGRILPRQPDDRRALETIRILHLNRRRLRKHRLRIQFKVVKVMRILESAREGDREVVESLESFLADEYLADDALHAGVSRAVVRDPMAC